jgi:hypothetical protein
MDNGLKNQQYLVKPFGFFAGLLCQVVGGYSNYA